MQLAQALTAMMNRWRSASSAAFKVEDFFLQTREDRDQRQAGDTLAVLRGIATPATGKKLRKFRRRKTVNK